MTAIRLVALQFMVSPKFVWANPDLLRGVKEVDRESEDSRTVRKERNKGNEMSAALVGPTKRVYLRGMLDDLAAGYKLVDAKWQLRENDRGNWDHVISYLFAKKEFALESPEFALKRNKVLAGLSVLCERFMWRAQAFQNPFFQNEKAVEGFAALSMNFKEREELFSSDGRPVMVWPKDERGKRVGEAPLPLKANYYLRIVDGAVDLATA